MTLEEALKRVEFLEKALNGAIDFAGVQLLKHYRNIEVELKEEPELAEYIMERKKNNTAT